MPGTNTPAYYENPKITAEKGFKVQAPGGQSYNLFLILFIFSTPVLIGHLWQVKTVVFLHCCRICAVPLVQARTL